MIPSQQPTYLLFMALQKAGTRVLLLPPRRQPSEARRKDQPGFLKVCCAAIDRTCQGLCWIDS